MLEINFWSMHRQHNVKGSILQCQGNNSSLNNKNYSNGIDTHFSDCWKFSNG